MPYLAIPYLVLPYRDVFDRVQASSGPNAHPQTYRMGYKVPECGIHLGLFGTWEPSIAIMLYCHEHSRY